MKFCTIICLFISLFGIGKAGEDSGIWEISNINENTSKCWTNGKDGNSTIALVEGESVELEKSWFECRSSKLVPKGCIVDGQRIKLSDTFIANGYLTECFLNYGFPELKHVGCAPDGVNVYSLGQSWVDKENKYWYECVRIADELIARMAGCIAQHENGTRMNIGERYDLGEYTYECQQKFDASVELMSVGCIYEGKHFAIGEQWADGDFIFYCKRTSGKCQKACIGCIYNGQALYNGDRYRHERSVYQCSIRQKRHSHEPVACLAERDVERIVGCIWTENVGQTRVERSCIVRESRAVVETQGCVFMHNGFKILVLPVNSYTIWRENMDSKPFGVMCREEIEGEQSYVIESFETELLEKKTKGLTFEGKPHMKK